MNLVVLNREYKLPYIDELIDRKIAGPEKGTLQAPEVDFYRGEYRRSVSELESSAAESKLPDVPSCREALNDLLVRCVSVDRIQITGEVGAQYSCSGQLEKQNSHLFAKPSTELSRRVFPSRRFSIPCSRRSTPPRSPVNGIPKTVVPATCSDFVSKNPFWADTKFKRQVRGFTKNIGFPLTIWKNLIGTS